MKNDILFIGATHGDERIGVDILRELTERRQDFDWIIGNPKAFEQGSREYEGDLNRSAPGNPTSDAYASRRAAEILRLAKNYCSVIDIHGTKANTGIFIIITKVTQENLELASRFDIQNIVIWPSFSPELRGPLSEFFSCGLEIECGPKDSPIIREQLASILEAFLAARGTNRESAPERTQQRFYEVYGSLLDDEQSPCLKDFEEITIDGETFCPLLVDEYKQRQSIVCYKMKRITDVRALLQA